MPELPEVEITRRGISPSVVKQTVQRVNIHTEKLRWPIPPLHRILKDQCILDITRRGKYLLFQCKKGTLIIHLGMSGCLKLVDKQLPRIKHDHVEFYFKSGVCLRFNDPRRFGAMLWTEDHPENHPRLCKLGVEPLHQSFNAELLYQLTRDKRCPIKALIMNSHCVVGVGNIYAAESLFIAGISPVTGAHRLSLHRCEKLVEAIKTVLSQAINAGGTTLKDFRQSDGQPGYFKQELLVYGRGGEPCPNCSRPIKQIKQQQRSSFYCTHCQH